MHKRSMEKLASTMLEKAQQFVEANPQLVKNTLLAGGLGAVGGALLPDPVEDEDEPASTRVRRRLKNALLGAAVVGGTGALLSNAAYNFGTAKLQRQLTPEEKAELAMDDARKNISEIWNHPLTMGGSVVGGGLVGRYGVAGVKDNRLLKGDVAAQDDAAKKIIAQVAKKNNTGGAINDKTSIDSFKNWLYTADKSKQAARQAALSAALGGGDADTIAKQLRAAGLSPSKAGYTLWDSSVPLMSRTGKVGKAAWQHLARNKRTALLASILPALHTVPHMYEAYNNTFGSEE